MYSILLLQPNILATDQEPQGLTVYCTIQSTQVAQNIDAMPTLKKYRAFDFKSEQLVHTIHFYQFTYPAAIQRRCGLNFVNPH